MRKAVFFVFVALFVLVTFNSTYCQTVSGISNPTPNFIYAKLDSETIGVMSPPPKNNDAFIVLHEYRKSNSFFVYIDETVPGMNKVDEFISVISTIPEGGEHLNIPVVFIKNDEREFPYDYLNGVIPLRYDCYINSLYTSVINKLPDTYLSGTLQLAGNQTVSAVVWLKNPFNLLDGWKLRIIVLVSSTAFAFLLFYLLMRFLKRRQ